MKTKKVNPRNKRMFHGLKKTKRSINVEGKWKAVELDPSLFAEEGMEGLVCFEELTNYSMLDSEKMANDVEKQPKKNKKAKKRKSTGEEEAVVKVDAESKEADETVEPAKKKAKKKNKSKTKKLNSEESDLQDDTSAKDKTQDGVDRSEAEGKNQATHEDIVKCVNSTISEPDASPKPSKRSKKRKKSEKGTVTVEGSNCESHSEHQDVIKDKMPKPVKRQQKNWTEVVLDGCNDRKTDVSAWKDLFVPAPVLKALSSLGFGSPTPIQALTLPSAIRDHKDILGAAETGSGKTLAFGIPMIHTILEWKKNSAELVEDKIEATIPMESLYLPEPTASENYSVEEEVIKDAETESEDMTKEEENAAGSFSQPLLGLVLTPTRELAVQVKHHIDAVSKFTDIKTAIVVGGLSQEKQRRMLKLRPEIIIATPGRLWDLIKEKHPHLQNLRQVRCLVIDEADRMVERGHFAELENLLEMLKTAHFNPLRQMFVFSATLTTKHSLPTRLLQKRSLDQRSRLEILIDKVGIKAKPKIVDLTRKEATVETLTETCIQCQKEEKDFYLYYFLLRYPGRTMVFANSIDCIKRLNSLLVILDCDTLPLHANMHQKQRLKNLERFAERNRCVLLTTDVAARGLDIPNVQHVIHYQVPRTSETYVHRSGRTARATKEGLSLLLIGPDDMMNFKKIYRTLGKDEELPMFPIETKCMEAIKERVNLARQIEKVEFHNSRKKHHNSWLKQAAEDMEIDLDDDLLIGKGNDEEQDREQKMMVKGMKKHLKHLISQPVFRSTMKTKYPTQMGKLLLPHTTLTGRENALSMVSMQEKKKLNKPVSSQQQKKGKKQK